MCFAVDRPATRVGAATATWKMTLGSLPAFAGSRQACHGKGYASHRQAERLVAVWESQRHPQRVQIECESCDPGSWPFVRQSFWCYSSFSQPCSPLPAIGFQRSWACGRLAAYCLFVLLHDPGFGREHLWASGTLRQCAATILLVFAVATVIGTLLVLRFASGLFLSFPRTNPRLWGLIMLLYPVLSVYPLSLIHI